MGRSSGEAAFTHKLDPRVKIDKAFLVEKIDSFLSLEYN
jgi:hypothetical protein